MNRPLQCCTVFAFFFTGMCKAADFKADVPKIPQTGQRWKPLARTELAKKKKILTPKVDDFHQGPAQKSETAFFFTKGQHNNPETALFVQTARDFENR